MAGTVNIKYGNRQGGSALLMVLLLMAVTTPLLCMLLDTHATHIRCTHNQIEGTTALYLAGAGIQDATGELLADPSWRTGFTDKTFPPDLDHTYSVTIEDVAGGMLITSTGRTAAGYTRTVSVTLTGF